MFNFGFLSPFMTKLTAIKTFQRSFPVNILKETGFIQFNQQVFITAMW